MKALLILSCVLISCSGQDPIVELDGSIPQSTDDGGDTTDSNNELTEIGELIVGFDTPAELVELDNRTNFLMWRVNKTFFWSEKSNATPIEFFSWPNGSFPGPAGELSTDFDIGTTYLHVIGRVSDTETAIVGAEHQLGAEVPLFGQPVIILNVGNGTDWRGLASFDRTVIAGLNNRDGIASPHLAVVAENRPAEFIDVPTIVSERFSATPTGPVFATTEGVKRFDLTSETIQTIAPGEDTKTTATDIFIVDGSTLSTASIDCIENCELTEVDTTFDANGWAVHDSDVATFKNDIVSINGSPLGFSNAPILSITIDTSTVFWATKAGIFSHPR